LFKEFDHFVAEGDWTHISISTPAEKRNVASAKGLGAKDAEFRQGEFQENRENLTSP